MALDRFTAPVRAWFETSFAAPTDAQTKGWPAIANGDHTLLLAPTGSGKTLAAFLWAIDRLGAAPPPPKEQRCRVLYISPLRALAFDVEKNLRAPLAGITLAAERLGESFIPPTVAMRTGDTPGKERQQLLRNPADILITTPESLYLMLTSRARETLRGVQTVIIDEIHALAPTKRGAHLMLSLERLEALTDAPPQRIGLSATQRPLDEIARFLGGFSEPAHQRPVTVVDAGSRKSLDVEVIVPVDDMNEPGAHSAASGATAGVLGLDDPEANQSIWPHVHPRILELVRAHRTTIVFCNARRLAERLAASLNELAGEELVRAHHGSLAREQRVQVESELKEGRLRAIVATSSLELGIDMGTVDLVVLVESPGSVARGIQRVGRAGHQVGEPSTGKIFPKYRGDLLEAAIVVRRMREGLVEEMRYPRNPLDVLAQQIVASCAVDEWSVDELYALVRRCANFAELSEDAFRETLDMLAGRYPSDRFSGLRPRVVWDRVEGRVRAREGAQRVAVQSGGTIPDRGLFGVFLPDGGRVGELDEEMVYESRVGECFVLGASTWRIEEITVDRVVVTPAPGQPAKTPFWKGDRPGRPLELGRALGALVRELRGLNASQAESALLETGLDGRAASNLRMYLDEQAEATGVVPDDRTIVIERFPDEIGDWRVCILTPFGSRVHAPWALVVEERLARADLPVQVLWSDDGIILRLPESLDDVATELLLPDPDEVEELLVAGLPNTSLFASKFRENAARALLIPRRRPGERTPLWQQRQRAADLLEVASGFPTFPMLLETTRECLRDVFDVPALREVLTEIRSRKVRVVPVETRRASPFAQSLLFGWIAVYMYEGDAPLAERRATALALDRDLLRDLMGTEELRELLDPEVLAELELELQRLVPNRRARNADDLHDLLVDLGPLTVEEVGARSGTDPEPWLDDLRAERRVIEIGGHLAAAEDAGRLRDALGLGGAAGTPVGVHRSRRAPARRRRRPLRAHARALHDRRGHHTLRYLGRTRPSRAHPARGRRPGGVRRVPAGWARAGVVRHERAAHTSSALAGRAAPRDRAGRRHHLRPIPVGVAGSGARPARHRRARGGTRTAAGSRDPGFGARTRRAARRVDGYRPGMLDELCAAGELVWIGAGALGADDGRVRLFFRDRVRLLAVRPSPEGAPDGAVHDTLRDLLLRAGASFWPDLVVAAGTADDSVVLTALWDLVWAGEVTNDTFGPLRVPRRTVRKPSGRARPHPGRLTRLGPPAGAGRWSLVVPLLEPEPAPTERAHAFALQLLDRQGVVTREAVRAEGVTGGFAGVYPVLRALEESGRARRGWFVDGLGAAQFALPGAVDRLRAHRTIDDESRSRVLVLAATDPAQPYGAALSWPERPSASARPSRSAGAYVVLVDGVCAAFLERGGKALITFRPDPSTSEEREIDPGLWAEALVEAHKQGRLARVQIERIDDEPARTSPLAPVLRSVGFSDGYKGLTLR